MGEQEELEPARDLVTHATEDADAALLGAARLGGVVERPVDVLLGLRPGGQLSFTRSQTVITKSNFWSRNCAIGLLSWREISLPMSAMTRTASGWSGAGALPAL